MLRCKLTVPEALAGDAAAWLGPGALESIGRSIEEAGFDAVGVTDHPYPPIEWLDAGGHHALDPFVSLSFLAAGTTTLRLVTNVLVLPYRHPIHLAKGVATLDVLSGGRVIVGTAVGYLRPEFEVLGADFEDRVGTFERTIADMRAAWATAGRTKAAEAGGFQMEPPTTQAPFPPIWIGGNSAAARRRAVTLGDGWMPFSQGSKTAAVTGTPPMRGVEDFTTAMADLRSDLEAAGRFGPFDVCIGLPRRFAVYEPEASTTERVDAIRSYADAGATWISFQSRAKTPDDLRRELDHWHPLLTSEALRS